MLCTAKTASDEFIINYAKLTSFLIIMIQPYLNSLVSLLVFVMTKLFVCVP